MIHISNKTNTRGSNLSKAQDKICIHLNSSILKYKLDVGVTTNHWGSSSNCKHENPSHAPWKPLTTKATTSTRLLPSYWENPKPKFPLAKRIQQPCHWYSSLLPSTTSLESIIDSITIDFEPISNLGLAHLSSMPNAPGQKYTYEEYNMKYQLSKIRYKVNIHKIANSLTSPQLSHLWSISPQMYMTYNQYYP